MSTSLVQLIGAAFGDAQPFEPATPVATSRRRRKLWELPARWHCPLIGSCVPVAEMRRLAGRAGLDAAVMSDYTLHTIVVSSCVLHAAYYRLKDACKELGKPCVFVQSPGIGSFARGLAVLAGEDAPGAVPIHIGGRNHA